MPQIGPLELIVVALVALIVFGPNRLPEIARTVGRTINELRRQAADVRGEFTRGFNEDDSEDTQVSEPSVPPSSDAPDRPDDVGPNA